jgi:hypothetical protein
MADSSPKSPPEGEQFDEEFDLSKFAPRLQAHSESIAKEPQERPRYGEILRLTVIILRGRP